MLKIIVGLVMVAMMGYVVYNQFSEAPLDARGVIASGVDQVKATANLSTEQEQLLRVQLAIADYMATNKGNPPDDLEALVPKYFDSIPADPATSEPYKYAKNGRQYQLGAQISDEPLMMASANVPAATGPKGKKGKQEDTIFVNPNTLELDTFTYDPTNKRDPFEPFDFSPASYDSSVPPLERYSVGQLRVTAILADPSKGAGEWAAIVEDATGRGYTVRKGTKIGNNHGVVVSIEKEKINIVETAVDFTGAEAKTPLTLEIPPRGGDDEGTGLSRPGARKRAR